MYILCQDTHTLSCFQMESREITRLFRVLRTIKEIAKDRHYTVSPSELNMTLDDFKLTHVRGGSVE